MDIHGKISKRKTENKLLPITPYNSWSPSMSDFSYDFLDFLKNSSYDTPSYSLLTANDPFENTSYSSWEFLDNTLHLSDNSSGQFPAFKSPNDSDHTFYTSK